MTIKEQVAVSQEARQAAESIRRGVGGKYDREHERALEAFARFERETLERAAKVAEGEKYGERVTQATYNEGNDTLSYYNEACDDIAQAIRSLTDRK